jgi:hypothetical protein
MEAALTKIFGTRISFYSIAALIAALLVVYGVFSIRLANTKAELTTASAEVQQLQGVNQQNALTIQQLKAQHALDLKALAAAQAANTARAAETASLHERINNAKPTDDGPVAPVLRDLLSSLRSKAAGGAVSGR